MGTRNPHVSTRAQAFSLPMKLSLATLAAFAIAATLGAGAGVGQGPPVSYIVVFKNGVPTDAKTLALQGQMGFTARHRFHAALHGFAAALTGPQLARIQQDTNVAFTSEDRQRPRRRSRPERLRRRASAASTPRRRPRLRAPRRA